ncbi:MAG: hypothetical protein LBT51_10940, partial [Fusobacteriaceae bacterium]|nr:hypothetical protein [Fusobacteriaceae bacterium]
SKTLLELMKTMDVSKKKTFNNNFASQYYFEYCKKNILTLPPKDKFQFVKNICSVILLKLKIRKFLRLPYRIYKKIKSIIFKISKK